MPLVTFATPTGASESFELDASVSIAQVVEFLHAALGVPPATQTWTVNGRRVVMNGQAEGGPAVSALQGAGWNGDVVLVHAAMPAGSDRRQSRANANAAPVR